MIDSITITIPGAPRGKGRPRFARLKTGGTVAYTDAKTRAYEEEIRLRAKAAMHGRKPIDGPVLLDVFARFTVPRSWPEWKRAMALSCSIEPTTKPDIDNLIKAALDAMNGIVFRDDAQVVGLRMRKSYHTSGSLCVHVTPMHAQSAQTAMRPS